MFSYSQPPSHESCILIIFVAIKPQEFGTRGRRETTREETTTPQCHNRILKDQLRTIRSQQLGRHGSAVRETQTSRSCAPGETRNPPQGIYDEGRPDSSNRVRHKCTNGIRSEHNGANVVRWRTAHTTGPSDRPHDAPDYRSRHNGRRCAYVKDTRDAYAITRRKQRRRDGRKRSRKPPCTTEKG